MIHTVGPVWYGGDQGEPMLLASCYRRSLQLAAEHRLVSVAFPAISCGVYGYPPELAVPIAIDSVRAWRESLPHRVVFCCHDATMAQRFRRLLDTA